MGLCSRYIYLQGLEKLLFHFTNRFLFSLVDAAIGHDIAINVFSSSVTFKVRPNDLKLRNLKG